MESAFLEIEANDRMSVDVKFPPGWDEQRVQRLIAEYEAMTEDELVAEDEAAARRQAEQTECEDTRRVEKPG